MGSSTDDVVGSSRDDLTRKDAPQALQRQIKASGVRLCRATKPELQTGQTTVDSTSQNGIGPDAPKL